MVAFEDPCLIDSHSRNAGRISPQPQCLIFDNDPMQRQVLTRRRQSRKEKHIQRSDRASTFRIAVTDVDWGFFAKGGETAKAVVDVSEDGVLVFELN